MRELKFRALLRDQHFKGWQYFGVLDVLAPRQDFDQETICQFTGLKDKNGVEIYEGDVVSIADDWDEPSIHQVKWGGDYPAFEIYPGFDLESNNLMSAIEGEGGMTIEVIGNVNENPELLTNEENEDEQK